MAFNLNYTNELSSNYLNDYPDSDSDDHFKPRNVLNIADHMQSNFIQNNSQFSFQNANERQNAAMDFEAEEEMQISYKKSPDNNAEFELELDFNPEQAPFYSWNNDRNDYEYGGGNEMFECSSDKAQLREADDMEVEESDYQSNQSTAFTCDFDDNMTLNQSQLFLDPLKSLTRSEAEPSTSINFDSNKSKAYSATSWRTDAVQMREIVDKILQGRSISDMEAAGLNDFDKIVIMLINERKSKKGETKTAKRREEKQKLFFKAALKYIENRFLSNISRANNGVKKKDINPDAFYLTYFQEVAIARNLDISAFYPPNQRRRCPAGAGSELKSFNLKYIELLLSSKRFFEETVQFLQNEFVENYSKSRYKKIDKILEYTTNIFAQTISQFGKVDDQNQQLFFDLLTRKLQDSILKNSKSKLPWSNAELEEAKEFAKQTMIKFYEKGTLLG